MRSKEQILQYLRSIKSDLQKDGITQIGIFGSFAQDRADLLSDIDLIINTTKTFSENFQNIHAFLYLEQLREKIKNKFGREVDIYDKSALKDHHIIDGAIYA